MELHNAIKEARKRAKLTQVKLAERAQVGRRDISRIETGKNVGTQTFLKVIGALPNLDVALGPLRLLTGGQPAPQQDTAADTAPREAGASDRRNREDEPADADDSPKQLSPNEVSLLRTMARMILELLGEE